MITFMPMLMWVAALIATGGALYVSSKAITLPNVSEALLRWLFVFPLGLMALWDFIAYGFLPQTMADRLGWAPSPFQMDVALANLGIGVASLYAAFAPKPARIAVVLIAACFLIGTGLSQVNNIMDGDDLAAGAAGALLLEDFLTPVALLLLLFLAPDKHAAPAQKPKPAGMSVQPARPAAPQRALPPPRAPQPPTPTGPRPPAGSTSIYPPASIPPPPGVRPNPPRAPYDSFGSGSYGGDSYGTDSFGSDSFGSTPPSAPKQPQRPTQPPRQGNQPMGGSSSYNESLEDELERVRQQMMDDIAKGRKR